MNSKRLKTGLVYDGRMVDHRCLWNDQYPECPERLTKIIDRCNELKLIDRCLRIPSRPATLNEILLKHTQEHYDLLKTTDGETNEDKLEEMCTHYDVFVHPSTFKLSLLAVGCAIELVDKILSDQVRNGMAIIRPPGHHAMEKRFDGFCFFNNVAIAAQHAINNYGVNKILIVDFDVHHGQGTQQLFYDDPRVLYFSVHSYQYGICFPGLRESDFDYVGEGRGEGFNFNVPLNKNGMTNADYLAIWQQILLPVAFEFQPELVLISAGYDAAYGCPLGEMEVTPACYAHLVSPLMTLAEGKIAAFLEGGYNLESLSESAAITLKTFLGDPCPSLEMLDEPSESVMESILNCTQTHKTFWKCLQVHDEYNSVDLDSTNIHSDFHQVIQKFIDDKELNPWVELEIYDTRVAFPNQTRDKDVEAKISQHLQYLRSITDLSIPLNRVCFVASSDERIQEFLVEHNIRDRLHGLQMDSGKWNNCLSKLNSSIKMIDTNVWESSKPAATLELLNNVLHNEYRNGFSIDFGDTFVSDNVALATHFALEFAGLKRVLILDFDKKNPHKLENNWNGKVLYMSLDHGRNNDSSSNSIQGNNLESDGPFTVNIPLDKETVNDADYVAAFQRIIMPIAYEFNPEVVLVSADFDGISAVTKIGNISPESFSYLTQWISSLANGKIILFMKGDNIAMSLCLRSLLGDPLPRFERAVDTNIRNIKSIRNVMSEQQKQWKSLKFIKMLPVLH